MAFALRLPADVTAEVDEMRSWTLWQSRAARNSTPSARAIRESWSKLPPELRDITADVVETVTGEDAESWLSAWWPEEASCPPSLVAELASWDGRFSHLVEALTAWTLQRAHQYNG